MDSIQSCCNRERRYGAPSKHLSFESSSRYMPYPYHMTVLRSSLRDGEDCDLVTDAPPVGLRLVLGVQDRLQLLPGAPSRHTAICAAHRNSRECVRLLVLCRTTIPMQPPFQCKGITALRTRCGRLRNPISGITTAPHAQFGAMGVSAGGPPTQGSGFRVASAPAAGPCVTSLARGPADAHRGEGI